MRESQRKAPRCILCGSSQIAATGIFLPNDGEMMVVYSLCERCWRFGTDTVAVLVDAALEGMGFCNG
jgi:hypothetical protein